MATRLNNLTLKQLLNDRQYQVIAPVPNFRPLHSERMAAQLNRKHGDTEAVRPKDFNPKTTYEEIVALHGTAGSLDALSARSMRQAPWVCFFPIEGKPTLGREPGMVNALLDAFAARGRPSLALGLLHCFLRDYPDDWRTFEDLRKGTKALLEAKPDRRVHALDRANRYFLLDKDGPTRLARVILLNPGDIRETMAAARLVGELEAGQFTQACFGEMCRLVRTELKAGRLEQADLTRFLDYAGKGDFLRFPALKTELANCLLEPLDAQEPEVALKGLIQGFLIRHLHDPRLAPGKWVGVSETARNVILRWLVGATLEDFFHVLDKTAPGTEQGRRWTYRKSFWRAFNRKRYITDAWIALGPGAKTLVRRSQANEVLKYGTLEGGSPEDCLLLLRIGNLTIVEWSHTGMCRFWLAANKTRPEFYKYRYYKSAISSSHPDKSTRHAGAQTGHWQADFAAFIASNTGARVTRSEYMPKGSWD